MMGAGKFPGEMFRGLIAVGPNAVTPLTTGRTTGVL
jgi:hypothetical protein